MTTIMHIPFGEFVAWTFAYALAGFGVGLAVARLQRPPRGGYRTIGRGVRR